MTIRMSARYNARVIRYVIYRISDRWQIQIVLLENGFVI